jgi:hypothetical protein
MLAEEFEALQGLRSGGALGMSKFRLLIRPLCPLPNLFFDGEARDRLLPFPVLGES